MVAGPQLIDETYLLLTNVKKAIDNIVLLKHSSTVPTDKLNNKAAYEQNSAVIARAINQVVDLNRSLDHRDVAKTNLSP